MRRRKLERLAESASQALEDGETEKARVAAEILIENHRRRRGENHNETLEWRGFKAKVLIEARRFSEAEAEFVDLLLIRERNEGVDSRSAMRARGNLARTVALGGRTDEALLAARALLEDRRRLLGDDHPETLDSAGHIAHFTHLSGESEAAAGMYADLLEKRRAVLGPDHLVTRQTEQNLIAVSAQQSDESGLEQLRRSAEEYEQTQGPDHAKTLLAYGHLAQQLVRKGDYVEGLQLARHVQASRERMLGPDAVPTQSVRQTVARALAGLGQTAEALEELFGALHALDRSGVGEGIYAVQILSDIVGFGVELLCEDEAGEVDETQVVEAWERLIELARDLPPDHLVNEVIGDYTEFFEQIDDEDE
jgi:hypothetical protein